MSDGRRLLLWLARERPPSASATMRALSKTIGWLVPVCVVAVVVAKQLLTPEVPENPYERAYPDLCAQVPAVLVADAVEGGVRSLRILDRDSSECAWETPSDTGGATLTVYAARPDALYGEQVTFEDVIELYEDRREGAESDSTDNSADPVPALGDEAVWYESADEDLVVGVLVVRSGVRVLSVTLSTADHPLETVRAKAEAIAAAVLPSLPPE